MPREFSADLDAVLRAVAQGFAAEGDARSVAILAGANARTEITDSDNWNGGTYGYTIYLEVPARLYVQLAEQQADIEARIKAKCEPLIRLYENTWIHGVVIATELVSDPDWKKKANAWLAGEGINNQGRVRSDNIASREEDGLLFRSQEEIHLYKAIKSLGLTFAPLPVFLHGGADYKRIEPDFVIFHKGLVLVVEVDGDTVHHESPAAAHARTTMLEHAGARIIHISASECRTPEKAMEWARKLPALIETYRSSK